MRSPISPTTVSVAVIIPARDEAATIESVVRAASKRVRTVIVVDDGSQDATASRAESAGAIVIRRKARAGKGAALEEGIRTALTRAEIEGIIFMDADGQHDPNDLERFLDSFKREKPDIIFGVRIMSYRDTRLLRRIWNKGVSRLLSAIAGRKFEDTQCGFRLFSRRALETLHVISQGYTVETEMLLEAVRRNLSIAEIPTRAMRNPKKPSLLSDATRALKILAYIVVYLIGNLFGRARGIALRRSPLMRWVSYALLSLLAVSGARQALRTDAVIGSQIEQQDDFVREMHAALLWLHDHSNSDAVVMAHWFRGHQIAAVADRRAVATTKAYPSEAQATAARYRDIADFFLNENEENALSIAARYRVSYVFLDKDFQAWLCKADNKCEYATSDRGSLNPTGLSRTVAGRMIRRGSFQGFQLVWDSPRFVIYAVSEHKPGLSTEEKLLALKIARAVIVSAIRDGRARHTEDFKDWLGRIGASQAFAAPRGANIVIWNHGYRRADAAAADGSSLIDNIVRAASMSSHDEAFHLLENGELDSMRIQLTILGDDIAPLTSDKISAGKVDPIKGYRLTRDKRTAYVLPNEFVSERLKDFGALLPRLCSKLSASEDCWKTAKPETFSVEDFMEGVGPGALLEFSGPVPVIAQMPMRGLLSREVKLAADWLVRIQKPDGRFPWKIDPLTGTEAQALDINRNAISGQSLAVVYQATGDRRYLEAAQRSAAYVKRFELEFRQRDPQFLPPWGYLKFSGLENIALYRATGSPNYLAEARRLADALLALQKGQGLLRSPETTDNQTFYFIAQLAKAGGGPRFLDEALHLAPYAEERFRSDRILKPGSQTLSMESWLVGAFASLYEMTGKADYADFAFEVADWLADYQVYPAEKAREGAFFTGPRNPFNYSRGAGKASESLVEAYVLARALHDRRAEDRYGAAVDRAFRWLAPLQITQDTSYFIDEKNSNATLGNFRHDLLEQDLWEDAAAHFLLGAANYLRYAH